MKLIDLLVKELTKRGGWPEGYDVVSTNGYGAVWAYKTKGCTSGRELYLHSATEGHVTRAQYEAALAKNDGWIDWGGGECPVDGTVYVDVKLRSGHVTTERRAYSLDWNHYTPNGDGAIIAYRPHRDINSRANDDRLEQDLNECIGQDVDQAWNGEGLPPLGVECEWQDKNTKQWQPVKVVYTSEWVTVIREINKEKGDDLVEIAIENYGDDARLKFRPLRTEAEKLREKLAASLHIAAGASPIELNGIGPLYFKLADAISSGKIPGVKLEGK